MAEAKAAQPRGQTNARLKIERSIDLFNRSVHPRTISGIARTLGEPFVSAVPSSESASQVILTVAWELSWYQYTVDLSNTQDPVTVRAKGPEIEELPQECKQWNLRASPDGHLQA